MNDGFKQRLIGAIILISLALIFWPIIFSDGINPAIERRSQISVVPAFVKHSVPQPQRPANIQPLVKPDYSDDQTVSPEPVITQPIVDDVEPTPKARPSLDDNRLPLSWILQVASFTQKHNADELTQTLLKQGYKAYTRTISKSLSASGAASTRVYIGPRLTKEAFDKDRSKIDREFSVSSIVIRFEQ